MSLQLLAHTNVLCQGKLASSTLTILPMHKECVSLFIELYKKTVSVLCVASDFLPDLALYIHIFKDTVGIKLLGKMSQGGLILLHT